MKQMDAASAAALAAFAGQVQRCEDARARVDMKLGKMTQGFSFRSLRDAPERKSSRPYAKHHYTGATYLHTHMKVSRGK